MKQVMFNEYNSDARWMQVKGKLETRHLKAFMQESDIGDVIKGLYKLVKNI